MTYLKDEYVGSYLCKIVLICKAMGKSQVRKEKTALKSVCHFKSYLVLVTFMPSLYKFKPWIKVLRNCMQKSPYFSIIYIKALIYMIFAELGTLG